MTGLATTAPSRAEPAPGLSLRQVARFWWPLAASWMLMGSELPAVSAITARLPDPRIHLGAYNVVFSLSLIFEAPVIMLLAASTALSRDWDSYLKLRRFMTRTAAVMTGIHALVAFTPLYDVVMVHLIGLPGELMEPARVGLRIMTPWTGAIAFRRFNQGVLIRFDHTRAVGLGTVIRLTAAGSVLAVGYLMGTLPGIVVGTSAVISGVLSEAVFAGLRVRPVLRDELRAAPPVQTPLDFRAILDFYVPLALTSFILLLQQPMGNAALSRAPMPIDSLAVWPVMGGLIFIFRSMGMAYNEVVVALFERPDGHAPLRRFAVILSTGGTLGLLIIAATPLSQIIFEDVFNLPPELAGLARAALPFGLVLPGLQAWISWHQGILTQLRHTRSITESVVISVVVTGVLLWLGVTWGQAVGVFVGWVALSAGALAQSGWLWLRSSQARKTSWAEAGASA